MSLFIKLNHMFRHYSKVKQSRIRPGVAQRVPGGLGSRIFMTFGTWRWWGRQPHAPAAFIPRNVPCTHFHLGLSRSQGHDMVERHMSLKNPVTPPGIDPGTVRLVAQRLNHYATPGTNLKVFWRFSLSLGSFSPGVSKIFFLVITPFKVISFLRRFGGTRRWLQHLAMKRR